MEEANKVICQICGKDYNSYRGFGLHLFKSHPNISKKDYYDNHIKKDPIEGICKTCNINRTRFVSIFKGYLDGCDDYKCILIRRTKTCFDLYGVYYTGQIPEKIHKTVETWGLKSKEDIQNSSIKMYNSKINNIDENGLNSFQRQQINCMKTCLEKYGVDNVRKAEEIKDTIKQVVYDRYGEDNFFKTGIFQEISRETKEKKHGDPTFNNRPQAALTCLSRYGVPSPGMIHNTHYSKISQEFCKLLYENLDIEFQKYSYFAGNKDEIWIRYVDNNRNNYYFYDFCLWNKKIIIEFQGDYWHRNPQTYEYNLENLSIWLKDDHKKEVAEENGFTILYVWESDYKNDKEKIIKNCLDFISSN